MTKRWKNERKDRAVRILAMGLNDAEQSFLQEYAGDRAWELFISQSDLDGWDHADHEQYDLCIVGQGGDDCDMDYLAWLLKDAMTPSRLILITSSCSPLELKHLRKYRIRYNLQRPVDALSFTHTIEKALIYNEPWYVRIGVFLRKVIGW